MSFLARMVNRAKWHAAGDLSDDEIPADAVTIDLKTKDNRLSFWTCGDASREQVGRVAVALVAGRQKLEAPDVAWLERSDLETDGIRLVETPGSTPVQGMVNAHVDAACLDLERLGRLARRVDAALRAGMHRRFNRRELRELLRAAVQTADVDVDALEPAVRTEIEPRNP